MQNKNNTNNGQVNTGNNNNNTENTNTNSTTTVNTQNNDKKTEKRKNRKTENRISDEHQIWQSRGLHPGEGAAAASSVLLWHRPAGVFFVLFLSLFRKLYKQSGYMWIGW